MSGMVGLMRALRGSSGQEMVDGLGSGGAGIRTQVKKERVQGLI